MPDNKNKILVALDGSEKAFQTVKYLCSFKPFLNKKLVLHIIITKVPECYYDLQKEPFSYNATTSVRAWEQGYKAELEAFMEKSKRMLITSGFKASAIRIAITEKKRGIARDIIDEAQKGYDALLIRRRGDAQSLLPLALGSVSTKLIKKAVCLPVMLAGVKEVNHALLIAIDGSEGAKRAVAFVAKTVENSDCRVVLCSVLRDFGMYDEKKKSITRVRTAFEDIETAIRDAKRRYSKKKYRG